MMNWGIGDVCWQAGTVVGSVAGSHHGCAGVEATVRTGHAPHCQSSNHFASYFGKGRLFFWSVLCSPAAGTTTLQRMGKQGRKACGELVASQPQFLAGCRARARTNSMG